jgi:membrane protein implicated in regulation of membrane protease activity
MSDSNSDNLIVYLIGFTAAALIVSLVFLLAFDEPTLSTIPFALFLALLVFTIIFAISGRDSGSGQ